MSFALCPFVTGSISFQVIRPANIWDSALFNNSYDFLLYTQFPPTEFLEFWVSLLSRLSKCHCIITTASKYAFPSVPVTWTKRKKTLDYSKWWRNMLHSEPQTYVITSETLQIFVPLSDLSNISDFGRLHSLKKDLKWKKHFWKRAKKGSNFFMAPPVTLL